MKPDRRRVALSLTVQEYEQLISISDYLGIKPTSTAHRALTQGLSIIFTEGKKLKSDLQFVQASAPEQAYRLKELVKPSGSDRIRTNTQRKQDAKKKRK
ncbi:MAG: hypothetical protein ACXWTK_01835 [Methylobacter sp.]